MTKLKERNYHQTIIQLLKKTKLEGLSNYDDTALAGRVTTLEGAGYQTAAQVQSAIDTAIAGADTCQPLTAAEITAIIGS